MMLTRRPLLFLLAMVFSALAVVALAVGVRDGGRSVSAQEGVLTLALDMDIRDGGPCVDVDESATYGVGDEYGVGVCLFGVRWPMAVLDLRLQYDDTLNMAPEISCRAGSCLDDNPDASAGTTVWGSGLGEGWDCNWFDTDEPVGHSIQYSGDGEVYFAAKLSCLNLVGPYTADEDTPVAVVYFQATAQGTSMMALRNTSIADTAATELGSCNPVMSIPMSCIGGSVTNALPTPTPTCPPDGCATPTPTPLPPSDSDGDGVIDTADRCPNTPEDEDGYQDLDGCPDTNNDRDALSDSNDSCPNAKEDEDGVNDEDGCPDPAVISTVPLGGNLTAVAANEWTGDVYVGDGSANRVLVLDADTLEVIANVTVPGPVVDVAAKWGEDEVTLAAYSAGETGGVCVIDSVSFGVIDCLPLEEVPTALAVNREDGYGPAYVAAGEKIFLIDGSYLDWTMSLGWQAEFEIRDLQYHQLRDSIYFIGESVPARLCWTGGLYQGSGCITPEDQPTGIGIETLQNVIYLVNADTDMISVYQGGTHAQIDSIPVGDAPLAVAIGYTNLSWGGRAYVSNTGDPAAGGDTVSVFEMMSNSSVGTIPVGPDPGPIAVNRFQDRIYVINQGDATLSVIQDNDPDGDGQGVIIDNCDNTYNPDQSDIDHDAVGDACDNCPAVANPWQGNTPLGSADNGALVPVDDISLPNEDDVGDACDDDDDNDGLVDGEESENSCPYRMIWDSDGDGLLDGYEVDRGMDPCAASAAGRTVTVDSDGDGVMDAIELRGWGTDPNVIDSDGDACPDDKEVVDIDGDRYASLADVMWVAKAALGIIAGNPASDLDKNGHMGVADAFIAAKNSSLLEGTVLCP